MAASDNLSPRQFFHGSSTEFQPGDKLQPAEETGVSSRGGANRVWVSTNAWHASKYGAYTYPVDVADDVKTPRKTHDEHHTSSATVTGPPVTKEEILRAGNESWAQQSKKSR